MERTIKIALNRFDPIPTSLEKGDGPGHTVDEITVNLASLYHHYYLDSYGEVLPNPDPTQFEYLRFLLPTPDFRFKGEGIGDCTVTRRHSSTALGQAFCRWFLHDHVNITYFMHMQRVLDKPPHSSFGGLQLKRVERGDVPDYLCSRDPASVFLAEAKGRYTPISFKSKEFNTWRKQFTRVLATDKQGTSRKIKGYVIGTRFATEEGSPTVNSKVFAEDPESLGESPLAGDDRRTLAYAIVARHYASIAAKLNQPLLASALESGVQLSAQLRVNAIVWQYQGENLERRRFVGGYFPNRTGALPIRLTAQGIDRRSPDPFRLDIGEGTFFGLEESIFSQVVELARRGGDLPRIGALEFTTYEQIEPFYSAISILRDGSILAPLEFFTPVEAVQL